MTTDTSKEAVERAAKVIRGNSKPTVVLSQVEAVALLDRAEAAEIDLRTSKISEEFWRSGWWALDQDKRAIEAKLVKAVEALGQIATDEHPLGWTAIAALREIKGE